MNAALEAKEITIGYGRRSRHQSIVASGLNLDLARGELVCLVGPNGVGKSTLLRSLAGLQPLLAGSLLVDSTNLFDLDLRSRARVIGVVLTDRVDVGILSAFDLVALGRHAHTGWAGKLTPEDRSVVRWALGEVDAEQLGGRNVAELSDGERQKLLIARALAQEPSIMVLDEPTAYLDLPRRIEMMGLLRRLAHTSGRSVVFSTHDLDLAIGSADVMWLMNGRGEVQTGAPEDLILDGEIAAAFMGEGIKFDALDGAFRLTASTRGTAIVDGEGLGYAWTKRALERDGFRVADSPNPELTVHVTKSENHFSWRVEQHRSHGRGGEVPDRVVTSAATDKSDESGERVFNSIYDLIFSIRRARGDDASKPGPRPIQKRGRSASS